MPWRHASPESERLRLIERYALGEESVAELSRQFGVSRKSAYKTIGRHKAEGEAGLLDRSRAPHYHPNATPPELVDRIIEMKREHLLWGPKKVVGRLRLIEPDKSWPSPSTAGVILDRAGLGEASAGAGGAARRGASPSQAPGGQMTCGRSTSRGGSAPQTGHGSTL